MSVTLVGQTMEARQRAPALGIGYRAFYLDAAQYGLTVPDAAIYFSSWGPDDFYHTAIVPSEDERYMEVLEEVRDALVPTKRIGFTQ